MPEVEQSRVDPESPAAATPPPEESISIPIPIPSQKLHFRRQNGA
jgi:hypothetical protein